MRATALILLLVSGCSGTSVSMELRFPDDASRGEIDGLQITAIEPFVVPPESTGRQRALLNCGELGVFGPTALLNRDQSELPGVNTLLNREGRKFPLEGDWTVDLEPFKSSTDSNPWRAVMVHIEARGPARKSAGGLALADESKTLLEGCFCMRLDGDATLAEDKALDDEVKASCPVVVEGTPRAVVLKPVINDQFRLEPCGVQAVTAPRGRQAVALPGVCVVTTECSQDQSPGCFTCRQSDCPELEDQKNVPIRVTALQAAGASQADPSIILTNADGVVIPQIQVDDCASPITIHAEVVGRTGSGIDFPVTCVDPIDFDPKPTDTADLASSAVGPTIAAIATIPGPRERVAVLLNKTGGTLLEIYEADGRALVLAQSLELSTTERGLGLLGFDYNLAAKTNPVLAVVSAQTNAPIVRVFRYDDQNGLVLLERTHDRRCGFDACTALRECGTGPGPCKSDMMLGQVTPPISMAVADRNGDGLADFSFATDRELQMYTYFSAPGFTDRPPPLDGVCQCAAYGRPLPSYEMINLGGPPGSEKTIDVLLGEPTGAFVRYATEDRVEGLPCSVTSSVPQRCGAGLSCHEICPGDPTSARCVEPCTLSSGNACLTSPLRPRCLAIDPGGLDGYCGGPGLACRTTDAVWPLTTVSDVAKGLISGDDIEDALTLGTPQQGALPAVRIFYGGAIDLTKVMTLSAEQRRTTFVDLTARRLPETPEAASARGLELGDFNGDGKADIAAIYTNTEEIRVWLGSGNLVPGEIGQAPGSSIGGRVKLNECTGAMMCPGRSKCSPFARFAVADLDADGKSEILVVCIPDVAGPNPTLKWFVPTEP